jgi:DNA-binding transcriptional MerR regulator
MSISDAAKAFRVSASMTGQSEEAGLILPEAFGWST